MGVVSRRPGGCSLRITGRWPRVDLARHLVALSAHRVLCETPPVSVGIHFVVVVNSLDTIQRNE